VVLTDVLTYHNDTMRSGQNLTETTLTPGNVASGSFGLRTILSADGVVDATPLIVSNVVIGGTTHTVVYIASENDSVYAYDADSFQLLQRVSLLGAGESPAPPVPNCSQVTPKIGITATPVIDRSAGPNGTLFLVAMSVDGTGKAFHRLHALDLATLTEVAHSPVTITATFGSLTLDPRQYKVRGALLLNAGQIYTGWASNCDFPAYNSWIITYNETTLQQTAVLNLTPHGQFGAIWNAGGLAADAPGSVYAVLGNGTFDVNQDYGNAAVRLAASGTTLSVADYYTPADTVTETLNDKDLGSGSVLLLPDQMDAAGATQKLLIAGGKMGNLYLINRSNMGHFVPAGNNAYQELDGLLTGGLFTAPAYYNGSVYLAGNGLPLYAFALNNALLPTAPTSKSTVTFAFPGGSPAVSANGSSNGIVWAVESNVSTPAVLHAYSAANLATEYYNSKQAANSRDAFGNGNKFVTPVIANGKVFVATPNGGGGVAVFGLL